MAKQLNPYTRLLGEIKDFCHKCKHPKTIEMWYYPKKRLGDGWTLSDLYERVAAAEQLGYDVQLLTDKDGLNVRYVEKRPDTPWNWRY